MTKRGMLIVLSGPSGVGKGTVRKAIFDQPGNDFQYSISMTTRQPRPGEKDGVDYFFVSKEEFENNIQTGQMLEYAKYVDNYYGTPRGQAEEKRARGTVLLDIDPMGARQVRDNEPETLLIFMMPPSVEELERRLRNRGDTSEDQIRKRMKRAVWEMEQRVWYDYVVVNDDAQRCAEEILRILANPSEN